MEATKPSGYSKYKELIGKVFGFSSKKNDEESEENKSSESDSNVEEEKGAEELESEPEQVKSLVLDLSCIAKDNPGISSKEKLEFNIQVFDQCLTSGWLV